MRVYTYGPEWGDGGTRLVADWIVPVDDPAQADVFCVPGTLATFAAPHDHEANARKFLSLPHLAGNEHRHVVIDVADNAPPPPVPGCIYFRSGDCPEAMLEEYPTMVPWPWPSDDLGECSELPTEGFRWHIGYVGYGTPLDLTPRATASVERHGPPLSYFIQKHDEAYWGGIDHKSTDPEIQETIRYRRRAYLDTLRNSRLTLHAVAKRGSWRYRFFEAWSAERIPLHIGDGCARPLAEHIPYDDLAVWVPEADVDRAGSYAMEFLSRVSDRELIERGRTARYHWARWLDRRRWPEIMAGIVRARLAAAC